MWWFFFPKSRPKLNKETAVFVIYICHLKISTKIVCKRYLNINNITTLIYTAVYELLALQIGNGLKCFL